MPQPLLTAAAMRKADDNTISHFGLPAFTLMETAGRGIVRAIQDEYEKDGKGIKGKWFWIFCGKGNNGGDGLVVARVLYQLGAKIHVISIAGTSGSNQEVTRNLHLLKKLAKLDNKNIMLTFFKTNSQSLWQKFRDGRKKKAMAAAGEEFIEEAGERIENVGAFNPLAFKLPPPDYIVDALLGTGLSRTVSPLIAELVHWMNNAAGKKIAIDIPTGLDSDHGLQLGVSFKANLTATMSVQMVGHKAGIGPEQCGKIVVIDIGIPQFIIEDAIEAKKGCAWMITDADVKKWMPSRSRDANKYTVGYVLAFVGARGLSGAAMLASRAAARIGAGGVVCAAPDSIQDILAMQLPEIINVSLPETETGEASDESVEILNTWSDKAKAIVVGCGIGRHPETARAVREFLSETGLPVVLDADGLNAFIDEMALLKKCTAGRWILTPHLGEFKRMIEKDRNFDIDIELDNRVPLVSEYAKRWNCFLLLKGFPATIGCPDGRVYINNTGNPSAATAGSGDVLAGICGGLLAQGLSPERAAVTSIYIAGRVADKYIENKSGRTMLAGDIIDLLPTVLKTDF